MVVPHMSFEMELEYEFQKCWGSLCQVSKSIGNILGSHCGILPYTAAEGRLRPSR